MNAWEDRILHLHSRFDRNLPGSQQGPAFLGRPRWLSSLYSQFAIRPVSRTTHRMCCRLPIKALNVGVGRLLECHPDNSLCVRTQIAVSPFDTSRPTKSMFHAALLFQLGHHDRGRAPRINYSEGSRSASALRRPERSEAWLNARRRSALCVGVSFVGCGWVREIAVSLLRFPGRREMIAVAVHLQDVT